MSSFRFSLIHGGGTVVLFLVIFLVLSVAFPFELSASEPEYREHTVTLGDTLADAGAASWLILLLGAAVIVATAIGAIGARSESPWPHWRSLVRGLGEAAFLIGIFSSVIGLRIGFMEITRLGAAVTPADLGKGLSLSLVSVMLGALVSIVALIGSGVLRVMKPRDGVE